MASRDWVGVAMQQQAVLYSDCDRYINLYKMKQSYFWVEHDVITRTINNHAKDYEASSGANLKECISPILYIALNWMNNIQSHGPYFIYYAALHFIPNQYLGPASEVSKGSPSRTILPHLCKMAVWFES